MGVELYISTFAPFLLGSSFQIQAAVFTRNLGPLARVPRRVMRRKRRAAVIHTVCGATAKDGVVQPQDRAPPPLPSLLTPLSPLQGQCSTKFLSPPPFLCLSGPECIHVATWGLNPWFDPSSALLPSPLPDGGKRERRARQRSWNSDLLLFQNPDFWVPPALIFPSSTHPVFSRDPGILVPFFPPCSHCQTACPGIQLSWPLAFSP